MTGKINYSFSEMVWQHASPGGWYFISLPIKLAHEIREALKTEEEGWGRLKAEATVGKSTWKTAIWFDTKQNTYLLPIKAQIRKQEHIEAGQMVKVMLLI